jgi:FKBP-type peptidyl-prolyl cis-trans isomerase
MDDQTNTSGSQPAAKLEGTKLAGFEPVESVAELQITDVREGNGDAVPQDATITAHYTGALCRDGTIFQSSHDFGEAITFPLTGVIAGWQQGVPGMKVGGIRRLVIPAAQAYGAQSPAPNIPPNSDLVFDIELVAIN